MAKRPCQGNRRDGEACRRQALKGKDFCRQHLPVEAGDTSDASDARAHTRGSDWDREAFLGAFEYSKMVSEACRMVGIHRSTAYLERERNKEFATAWDEIDKRVTEELEAEAFRRAVVGVPRKVVSAGQSFGTEQQYSDSLLQFLLKARRPEKYRDRVDVAHSGGVKHDVTQRVDLSRLSDEQLDALDAIEDTLKAA